MGGGGSGSAAYYPSQPARAPPTHGPSVGVGGYGMVPYHSQGAAMSPFHHAAMSPHPVAHAGAWSPEWVGGYAASPGGHAHGHGHSAQPVYGQPQPPPHSPAYGHPGAQHHHPGHGANAHHHHWAAPTQSQIEYHAAAAAAMHHHGGAQPPMSPGGGYGNGHQGYRNHQDHHGGDRNSAPADHGGGAALRSPPARVFRTQLSSPGRINQPAAPRHRLSGSGFAAASLQSVTEGGGGSSSSNARARHRHSTGQQQHQPNASPCSPLAARHDLSSAGSGSEAATQQQLPGGEEPLPLPLPLPLPVPVPVAFGETVAHAPRRWETSLFRLFTADATRGDGIAAWWTGTLPPGSAADSDGGAAAGLGVEGPFSCEEMILAFAHGAVGSDHYVCGAKASAGALSGAVPPTEMFERLGEVLGRVEDGREFELVEWDH